MTMLRGTLMAALLALAAPVMPAFAHDDDYYYNRHARDHWEHRRFHREVSEAHQRAHEDGFYSRAEHRAYHRALRDLHGYFHEHHPNTRHDHYDWRGYWWWRR
jgi:hypothetical protein